MHRINVYLTGEQRRRLARRAAGEGASQAEVIRRILDRELGIPSDVDEGLAIVAETSGVLAGHPDWPEWLKQVRGPGTAERLRRLGL